MKNNAPKSIKTPKSPTPKKALKNQNIKTKKSPKTPENPTLEAFKAYLKSHLPRVESFHPFFNEALSAMLLAGGKHFRAQLLLGIVEQVRPKLLEKAMAPALAIEFIHTYSLIHDDLPAMDNADFRRSVPTLHKRYDEVSAILVGDALNTEAFTLLGGADFDDALKIRLIKTLAFNAGINGMIIGQALDCFFEDKRLNLSQLEFLHAHKTARLIAASIKMGCEICGFSELLTAKLYEFGLKLGLAFQVNDDIIDAMGVAKDKPTKADTHKNSFVNLLGLDGAKCAKADLLGICENLLDECKILLDKENSHFIEKILQPSKKNSRLSKENSRTKTSQNNENFVNFLRNLMKKYL